MKKVLEVNVDDLNSGGVYSLVKNVIIHNTSDNKIDIAAIEHFESPDNIAFLKKFGCDVHYVGYSGSKWKKQLMVYLKLKRFLKTNHYDYVHIHADTANKLLVSGLASKHAKVTNIVLHSHSSGVEGGNKLKVIAHKLCSRQLKNIGTKFVACSTVAAKWMYPNIPLKKVLLVKNGIPLEEFVFSQEIREQNRKALGLDQEMVIGHVGRLMAPKNHEYLIEIVYQMSMQGLDVKLLLVGEGYKENELKQLVEEYGLQDKVIFYGISTHVNELLMAMDIFCLPSFFEGMPIVGIEAQATGLPVIYSNNVTREAKILENVVYLPIGHDDIKEWNKTILCLVKNTNRNITSNQQVRMAGFDISNTVKSFLNIYQ